MLLITTVSTNMHSHPAAVPTIVVVLTLLPLYYFSYNYHVYSPTSPWNRFSPSPHRAQRPAVTDFVKNWMNVQIGDPINIGAIGEFCNRSHWHPKLVFNLDDANGGVGNTRGNILDFVFQAIEAGASILLPQIAVRSETDLSNVWAGKEGMGVLFDTDYFLWILNQACPQMAVYRPQKGQAVAEALPAIYLPRSRRMDVDQGNTAEASLEQLNGWLKGQPTYKPDDINLVNLERTLWDIDTRSLPTRFRRNFGRILRLNSTAHVLAATVVRNLNTRFYLGISPQDPIPANAFFGAHLRTEQDAENAGWLGGPNANFSVQTDWYLAQAAKHKLNVIYVSSGSAVETKHFRDKARSTYHKVNITSKYSLLTGADLTTLNSMSWDQQALVDYEVLLRCSVFGGFVKSSFSYNIAITRNLWLESQGRVVDPWFVMHQEEDVAFDDGISRIWGRDGWHEQRIPRGMWP